MKVKPNWLLIVDEFEDSNLSHKQFCKLKKVPVVQFRNQLYRLRKRKNSGIGFSPVSIIKNEFSLTGIELHFPDGKFIRFSGETKAEFVRAFIIGLQ